MVRKGQEVGGGGWAGGYWHLTRILLFQSWRKERETRNAASHMASTSRSLVAPSSSLLLHHFLLAPSSGSRCCLISLSISAPSVCRFSWSKERTETGGWANVMIINIFIKNKHAVSQNCRLQFFAAVISWIKISWMMQSSFTNIFCHSVHPLLFCFFFCNCTRKTALCDVTKCTDTSPRWVKSSPA